MMGWYDMAWVGWLMNCALVLLLWALSVAAIIAALRAWSGSGRDAGGETSARQSLDDQFARGEIDAEEYVRDRDLLRSTH